LSVCHLSYPSDAFCVAWSWTPTMAFESLGFSYVCLHLAPPPISRHGQPERVELSGNEVDSPLEQELC